MLQICRIVTLSCLFLTPAGAHGGSIVQTFQSAGRTIVYEIFDNATPDAPLLILLPGTSGPAAEFYRSQAAYFSHNYKVFLLHYFDAASSHLPLDRNYEAWVRALEDLVRERSVSTSLNRPSIYVVGYSLGASIALAAGSQGLPVKAIAEWYGSLPDAFFYRFQTMPPLLILHGALDQNIPVINAAQLIRLCQMKSLTCADHVYADQSHGFSGAALEDAKRRTMAFFKEH
jgi:dienelactone hydrolase